MRTRVLAGNIPEWREILRCAADPGRFEVVEEEFSEPALASDGYDLAIPFTRGECELVRHLPQAAHRTLIPSERHRRLANDKLAFAQWLIDAGFGRNVPEFALEPVMDPPFIKKSRVGANGRQCRLYADESDLIGDRVDGAEYQLFYQRCVRGPMEYATHTVSVAGTLLFMGTTASLHDTDLFVKGHGETPRRVSRHSNVAGKEIRSILSALGYTGCACFDFKLEAGVPMFFEMNPRIGFSSHLFANEFLQSALQALTLKPAHPHTEPP